MPTELYNNIGEELRDKHGISIGQMFGKPCLKTSNKAFASFFMEEMVFKLGREKSIYIKKKIPRLCKLGSFRKRKKDERLVSNSCQT